MAPKQRNRATVTPTPIAPPSPAVNVLAEEVFCVGVVEEVAVPDEECVGCAEGDPLGEGDPLVEGEGDALAEGESVGAGVAE